MQNKEFPLNIGKGLSMYIEKSVPFVSIGSRVANAFTALVAGEAEVDPEEYTGVVERHGTVVSLTYGGACFSTMDAVYGFLTEHLYRFDEGIGEERKGIELVSWPSCARSNSSIISMLKELMKGSQAARIQSASGTSLLGDVEEFWCFTREWIRIIADPPGEVLKPRIVRWWHSSWASKKAPSRVRGRGQVQLAQGYLMTVKLEEY